MFTHVFQNLVGSIVTCCGRGLRSHSQWVDQSLKMKREQSDSPSSGSLTTTVSTNTLTGITTQNITTTTAAIIK